jgi:hypothetical protein
MTLLTKGRTVVGLFVVTLSTLNLPAAATSTFNVRDRGAAGDGKTLDTAAINRTIEVCSAAGGGQVLIPAGRYLTGTIQLKSNVTLLLEAGATIVGTSDLDQYKNFSPPGDTPLADQVRWHRALILGDGVENVMIAGQGVIDGNKVADPQGEEGMRGPHAVLFGNSRQITLRDVSIRDAANYAVMLELTSDVTIRGVKITGGWDGIHFRGWKDRPCRDIQITDCELSTGDDCIAGWYWEDTLIDRCTINSSCNGLRLIGPAHKLILHDCLFYGPGRYEHRTSRDKHRTNTLAGICLQPGAWGSTEGTVADVHISDVVMHDVASPLHIAAANRNRIESVTVDRLSATGAYRAATSIESWADEPVGDVSLRDVSMTFVAGSDEAQAVRTASKPGVDVRPLPAWGLFARNVDRLDLDNVRLRLEGRDSRPAFIAENVRRLELDRLQFPRELVQPIRLRDVRAVQTPTIAQTMIAPKCLQLKSGDAPHSVIASVSSPQAGLAPLELTIDGQAHREWHWLAAGTSDVALADLAKLRAVGRHQIRCGDATLDVVTDR